MKFTMKKAIKIIILFILIIILFSSIWKIYNYIKETNTNKKLNDGLIDKAVTINNENTQKEGNIPITVNFPELKKENSDIVGWIYCKDTPINYPVVQGQDNEFYIHRLINKKSGTSGTLFMDYRNDSNNEDDNTIIYGHNMKNGTMFGTIKKYKNQEYYDTHKDMYYITPKKTYRVEIFTGYTTSAESNIYDLNKFDKGQIKELQEKSDFENNVEINEEDKILTLSTCSYDYEDARYVLMGVLREI